MDQTNKAFQQAVSFVNHSDQHLFLTGKAGTGKTTFLRFIREHTYKKLLVMAPTGVAAINAGGSTIHSAFFLPFGLYLSDRSQSWDASESFVYNRQELFRKAKLTRQRRSILQEVDLIVIDEVSMLRADALDAIDTILRSVRRNAQAFGGVQMLFIGDLYQLPPVVTSREQELLYKHYRSSFFFDAKVMQEVRLVALELTKIYRQKDDFFVTLLNRIRNNNCTAEDLESLNKHLIPRDEDPKNKEESVITLTSHNLQADHINQSRLDALPGKPIALQAQVSGDFQESAYPIEHQLVLKKGAQVMFVKNDKGEERRYYNGKIGHIEHFDQDAEEIYIRFEAEEDPVKVSREEWKNQRSFYDEAEDEIKEETLGTFRQYPLRLAWAVTIHKSQGLTFDNAHIDAGRSFAAGQVYVALSRLRSLQGLRLSSPINFSSIHTDPHVAEFSDRTLSAEQAEEQLRESQRIYLFNNLAKAFLFNKLLLQLNELKSGTLTRNIPDKGNAYRLFDQLTKHVADCHQVAEKFRNWLNKYFDDPEKTDLGIITERTEKAYGWFSEALKEKLQKPFDAYVATWDKAKKNKGYRQELLSLQLQIRRKDEQIRQAMLLTKALAEGRDLDQLLHEVEINHRQPARQTNEKTPAVKKKTEKGATQRESLKMFKKGRSIEEIAKERELTPSTVIGHLTRFVGREIDVTELIQAEKYNYICKILASHPEKSLGQLKALAGEQVSFEELRIARTAFLAEEK